MHLSLQVLDWSLRLEKELSVLRSNLEEEQKKQITLIKQVLIIYTYVACFSCYICLVRFNCWIFFPAQVHEREHQREMAEQESQRLQELDRLRAELSEELRDSMEAAHQAELSQAQVGAKHETLLHSYYNARNPRRR